MTRKDDGNGKKSFPQSHWDDIRDRQLTKEQILEKVISPGDYQEAIAPSAKAEKKTATNSRFTSSIEGGLV